MFELIFITLLKGLVILFGASIVATVLTIFVGEGWMQW